MAGRGTSPSRRPLLVAQVSSVEAVLAGELDDEDDDYDYEVAQVGRITYSRSTGATPRQKHSDATTPRLNVPPCHMHRAHSSHSLGLMAVYAGEDRTLNKFAPSWPYDQPSSRGRPSRRCSLRRTHERGSIGSDLGDVGVAYMRANGALQQSTLLHNTENAVYKPPTSHSFAAGSAAETSCLIESQSSTQPSGYADLDGLEPTQPQHRVPASSSCTAVLIDDRSSGMAAPTKGRLSTAKSAESTTASNTHLPPNAANAKPTSNTRLVRRQTLYAARRMLADCALLFALIGIVLMIIENEMTAAEVYSKDSFWSYSTKIVIVLSTIVLLLLLVQYHHVEIQLFMNDNSAEDWRIAMTNKRMAGIMLELAVCAVCPLPGNATFLWTTVHADGETITATYVPFDVLLSIPMFFRLYLMGRVMLLHSRLFTDASSRSIGALNRVNFNARFVLKTLMTLCPGTVLLVVVASFWVIASWILRLCERYHTGEQDGAPANIDAVKHQNYLNSLWMIAITFLSVGYGDMVPNTYCGRAVAVISGIMGVSTSSMVVAVIARKLELTRAEKHVHNFMMDTQLTKRLKHAAANVLRETWLIYKHRRLVDRIDIGKIRMHQRKFLMAIYDLRKVKRDQRKLAENSLTIGDIAKSSNNTYELMSDMTDWQEGVTDRLSNLDRQVGAIHDDLRRLTQLMTQSSQTATGLGGGDSAFNTSSSSLRQRNTTANAGTATALLINCLDEEE